MKSNKWGIIVGKPRTSFWKNSSIKPDLTHMGKWVIGWRDTDSEVRWLSTPVLFDTRQEARQAVKKYNESSSWSYIVMKYSK
jgi:hypothetical protein